MELQLNRLLHQQLTLQRYHAEAEADHANHSRILLNLLLPKGHVEDPKGVRTRLLGLHSKSHQKKRDLEADQGNGLKNQCSKKSKSSRKKRTSRTCHRHTTTEALRRHHLSCVQ